jgi:hypothetical protein
LNSISPPTTNENSFNASHTTPGQYTSVVDVSLPSESVPTSITNPFSAMNTMHDQQNEWYAPLPRTPEPVLQPTPQQFFDVPSPFGFSQTPITQTTSLDDYLMPTKQPQPVDSIYDIASPFISPANGTHVTQPMPIVPAQSIDKNNSSTPPKLAVSLTTNSSPASSTDKKPKDKKKYFTLGRAKSKPEGKTRRTSAEATNEEVSSE